jgi:hypothetical protein
MNKFAFSDPKGIPAGWQTDAWAASRQAHAFKRKLFGVGAGGLAR